VPEAGAHTSIRQRVEHVESQGRTEDLKAAHRQRLCDLATGLGLRRLPNLGRCPAPSRGPALT
jgi:hypothetical protein